MKETTIKISELVEDFDLYPRGNVDPTHIAKMVEAMSAGDTLPAIIADRKTKRIVDGFHRRRALIRLYGEDAKIAAVLKDYKTDGEIFLDAVQHNSGHGRPLTPIDAVRSAIKAKSFGLDDIVVAKALRLTVDKVGELVAGRSAPYGKAMIPLKQTIRHMAGHKLTKSQVAANDKLGGMNQLFYVNQLVTLLEADLIDSSNFELMAGLEKLGGLIMNLGIASG